ncbi:MAG: phytanoyl-CoA dioxygenase family protein [Proteobacteria bacterium]|nr:phytanoyl-CoA dioxygenase family protein [Pseudomonadota bacterium]
MNSRTAAAQLLEDGWCVVPGVLDAGATADALQRLHAAAEEYRRRGHDTHMPVLDPNAANVRVFDLLDLDPVFRELIRHPAALALVRALLGPDAMISNFTANIARPGARSMSLHSDQALVAPEPWLAPWSVNIIWCLSDVHRDNGATLFIPGSHKVTRRAELGAGPIARLVPFEAKAGSIVAMDGRVWHTSGANVTANEERALLFGYYSRGFLRPQVNWNVVLSPEVQKSLDPELRWLLGLGAAANFAQAAELLAADIGRT